MCEVEKTKLKNTELVKHCANNLNSNIAWSEFLSRYEKRICYTITQECKKNEINKYCLQFEETVRDLVQDVYLKILENDCKALKKFRGDSENSIYSYLTVIAKNVVRNYIIKMQAQKRPQIETFLNMLTDENKIIQCKDKLKPSILDTDQEFKLKILQEEIDYCLAKIMTGKEKERNKLICQLHIYNGFSPNEIAIFFNVGISARRIINIISESRQKLMKSMNLA